MSGEIPDIPANRIPYVWVYKAEGSMKVSAVFSNFRSGHQWIKKHGLSGLLVHYPLDQGVYDWAQENGFLSKVQAQSPEWRAEFTPATQRYEVYSSGKCLTWPEFETLTEEDAEREIKLRETYYPKMRYE